eukprot:TRINITY_DN9643_c0_g2_i1.p1 TRINITY_DN9643_c0_g2~~TRINITY_DN9643_c0_g2_i1.p1  ORF type:complete len:394 (-),score=141.01 TRINITY_DN9643_c0_g2_i1:23-1204(-)
MADLEEWVCEELERLLCMEDVRDIARRLMSLAARSMAEAQEYAEDILGSEPNAGKFFQQFVSKLEAIHKPAAQASATRYFANHHSDPTRNKGRGLTVKQEKNKKNKSKQAGEEVEVRRFKCGCFGTEHEEGCIICGVCGRIHCGAEGEGKCFFCGSGVHRSGTIPNEDFLDARRKLAEEVNKNVPQVENSDYSKEEKAVELLLAQGLEKALMQKNKLMARSKDSGFKGRVIDDQEDFYDLNDVDTNVWLDDAEREAYEALAADNEHRLDETVHTWKAPVKVTLDFENARVVQEVNVDSVEYKISQIDASDKEKKKGASSAGKGEATGEALDAPPSRASHLGGKEQELYKQLIEAAKQKKQDLRAERKKAAAAAGHLGNQKKRLIGAEDDALEE